MDYFNLPVLSGHSPILTSAPCQEIGKCWGILTKLCQGAFLQVNHVSGSIAVPRIFPGIVIKQDCCVHNWQYDAFLLSSQNLFLAVQFLCIRITFEIKTKTRRQINRLFIPLQYSHILGKKLEAALSIT